MSKEGLIEALKDSGYIMDLHYEGLVIDLINNHLPDTVPDDSVVVPATRWTIKYNELINAVVNKIPNETRHETALRIIRQHESQEHSPEGAQGNE